MKNKSTVLTLSLLITCLTFIYLIYHHYATKLGVATGSLCQINEKLNCDAAALSSFSEILGQPVAVLGFSFNFILLLITIFYKLGWMNTSIFSEKLIKTLFIFSAVVSIIMAIISVVYIKVGCPFCILTYILSFINLFFALKTFQDFPKDTFTFSLWEEHKGLLFSILAVPIISWFISGLIQDNYGLNELKKIVPEKIAQWQNGTVNSFSHDLGLKKSTADSKIELIEYADFKCPHCKTASETLHTFLGGKDQITFIFKPFVLDGTCNPVVQFKGDGSRCIMAGMVLCAEKIAQKGWALHDLYFKNQDTLINVTDLTDFNKTAADSIGFDYESTVACSQNAETLNTIAAMGKEGHAAKVEGTPTIFLNGKKLPYGQNIEILRAAFKTF